MSKTTQKLVIMLKAPRPGSVKTRLARALGDEPACAAYRELVECLLANLASIVPVELRYAPDDAPAEIAPWLAPGWSSAPQGPGDLGQRLRSAVQQAFTPGPARLVIVGSDCPWVTGQDIHDAWRALKDHDLVLGPARDGGYWLIGLNRPELALFDGVTWSSSEVFQQTLACARRLDLKVHILRSLSDVDEEADWFAFKDRAG
jgi:hypothetical protein